MLPLNRTFRGLVSSALLIVSAATLRSQATSPAPQLVVESLGRGTVPIDGPWQFHTGDNMGWANPAYDDSSWEHIDVSRPWGDQGHWAYSGRAWYRRRIEIKAGPNGTREVSLYVPLASCAYEVYWNGLLIGATKPMPGQSPESQPAPAVFKLGPPERGILAFRAYSPPFDTTSSGNGQGLMAVPRLGNSEAIADLAARDRSTVVRSKLLTIVQILIYAQLFVLGAVVWLRNRKQKLPFWMAVFLLSSAFWTCQDPVLFPWIQTNVFASFTTGGTNHSFEDIALWYLLLYLLDLDRYPTLIRWTRILAWSTFLSAVLDSLVFYIPTRDGHAKLFQILDAVLTVGFSLPEIFPLILIALAFRQRMDFSRRFVAIAAFLSDMYFVAAHTSQQGVRFTRWTLFDTMTRPLLAVDGVEVSMPAIFSLLLACAIVYAVYRYMVEQGQRQTALEQEHRNARAVQQVLIPEAAPQVPGFVIESFYKPAGEVGGDFFQILATRDDGLLAVIGDVSGKGMPAAMTVSLLVGTVRTLAHFTESPTEILSAMNVRMLGRSQGGFTTCLVLRADPNGTLTIANAGHLPPYRNRGELTLENGLPLGLSAGSTYVEQQFSLAPGDRLTMLSDGVVEARDRDGNLFGFERTAAVSAQSAEEIAAAAEAFGQEDDITVLTVEFQGRHSAESSLAGLGLEGLTAEA